MPTQLNHRVNFGKIGKIAETPDLLAVQIQSFKEFFQLETTPDKRNVEGLWWDQPLTSKVVASKPGAPSRWLLFSSVFSNLAVFFSL